MIGYFLHKETNQKYISRLLLTSLAIVQRYNVMTIMLSCVILMKYKSISRFRIQFLFSSLSTLSRQIKKYDISECHIL